MTRRVLLTLMLFATVSAARGEVLRATIASEPKTFDPIQVSDESSDAIRYMTGGVLVRLNRRTQIIEPELATSWKVLEAGRAIRFDLLPAINYSDGTPFTAEDVAYTMKRLMDPAVNSPTADAFRSAEGGVETEVLSPVRVIVRFPKPVASLARLFDTVVILSSRSPLREKAVLGPFRMKEYKPGQYVLLERNPNYWKKDEQGRPLPYLDGVRLDIQQNRELEALRFRRGEVDIISKLDPAIFDSIAHDIPGAAVDAGASLESEQLWFNQNPAAPIANQKKQWFQSAEFRRAVSEAINREDLCRIVYSGRASAGVGPISPANKFWFNQSLKPHSFDSDAALARLRKAGFRLEGGNLLDAGGTRVEFTLVTNAGNKARGRIAAMIEQDLAKVGIRVQIVTLDFPALIDRMTKSFDYDTCLLGLVNVDLDPSSQMNVWLSSGPDHIWSPNQAKPATAWEVDIDRLMHEQAASVDDAKRKQAFDQVQRIVWEQAPMLYLVHRHALLAINPRVRNAAPAVLYPQAFWNIDRLAIDGVRVSRK